MKLEIGYNDDFEIRREFYQTQTPCKFSILFISDLHLNGFSKDLIDNLKNQIEALNPSILLLGGDYVDSKKGFPFFKEFLSFLLQRKNNYAIAGNHDFFYGLDKIKNEIIKNKVIWMDKNIERLNLGNINIYISNSRMAETNKATDFSILLQHNPKNIDKTKNKFNLAFAGHLHGCQFVFWDNNKGLYPGRLFYKWNILKTKIGDTYYLVSKGLGDTLPIRYNCKKDIIFVEVFGK